MTLTTFLLQALASLLAIITFLIVLNVQRSMLIPGGVLGMSIWLLYLILKEPTNVILATFIAAVIGLGTNHGSKWSMGFNHFGKPLNIRFIITLV